MSTIVKCEKRACRTNEKKQNIFFYTNNKINKFRSSFIEQNFVSNTTNQRLPGNNDYYILNNNSSYFFVRK